VSAREPRTEAGRSLHGGHCRHPETCDYLAAITAIEAEAHAAGLAEGRSQRAVRDTPRPIAAREGRNIPAGGLTS
jgi:hypothetical protein